MSVVNLAGVVTSWQHLKETYGELLHYKLTSSQMNMNMASSMTILLATISIFIAIMIVVIIVVLSELIILGITSSVEQY